MPRFIIDGMRESVCYIVNYVESVIGFYCIFDF